MSTLSVDIFCRVVDNYGDIGVCWRLARRFSEQRRWPVRLWVDDLSSFKRLAAQIDPSLPMQMLNSIEIRHWNVAQPSWRVVDIVAGDIVIEAFACDPPAWFVASMKGRAIAPIWLNLEYLSAEDWIEDCHGMASLRSDGLQKHFFFPGLTPRTGGLLREPGLIEQRNQTQSSTSSRSDTLQTIGLTDAARHIAQGTGRLATLFCYPHAPLDGLLQALGRDVTTRPTLICAAPGIAPGLEALAGRYGVSVLRTPFLPQPQYDQLLSCADVNIVRGEDSFVRALWAARPFLWHIYPQDDDAHLAKLRAWLDKTTLSDDVQDAQLGLNAQGLVSNDVQTSKTVLDWSNRLADSLQPQPFAQWQASARQLANALATTSDLADNIANFCISTLNSR